MRRARIARHRSCCAAVGLGMLAVAPAIGRGQSASLSAGYAIAEYSEQAALLSFTGSGPTASVDVWHGRVGLNGTWTQLSFTPSGTSAVALSRFTMQDAEVALRCRVLPLASVEGVVERRWISPTGEAEQFVAGRLGARIDYPLAPGASLVGRVAYAAAGSFSGGGSAPFGAVVGLGFLYGPGAGRVRIAGNYQFERLDRRTSVPDPAPTTVSLPIATSVGRLELQVRL